jgi:hypothetical protein
MVRFVAAGATAMLIAIACVASMPGQARATSLSFQTLDNPVDPTFNQLLGINNSGTIAGYFGSGAAGHPNKGYTLVPPSSYTNENFPGSVQTQVTGINNVGTTVGFWSDTNLGVGMDSNFGFVDVGGAFTNVNNPNTATTPPVFNQLLGVNDKNVAAGFYTDAAGNTHGYTYTIATNTFSADINDPDGNGTNTTATAINNGGEIAGFFTNMAGDTVGFLDNGGTFTTVSVPGAMSTMLLGLNNLGIADGVETGAAGNMHGIIFNSVTDSLQIFDDPNGIGTTTFNGLNDNGNITGFYVGGDDNTHGLLATTTSVPEPGSLVLLATGLFGLFGLRRRPVNV